VSQIVAYSDDPIKVFMSSWSPPSNLKSNNSVNGGGGATLKKDAVSGKYLYRDFAQYWVNSLIAYDAIGVVPDYISIQNEPSYDASWESCIFDPMESTVVAGYDRALDTVYFALQEAGLTPKIFGPEVHGIGYNTFQNYAQRYNHSRLDGYAFHLYHGDNENNNNYPDMFNTNLAAIAMSYPGKPRFQTEFDRGDWFNTVWLMHNCLVNGEVSGYFWWGLLWDAAGGKPLVGIENPWTPSGWTTGQGFILTPYYWAFRQYSKYIGAGWKRVTTEVDVDSLRMSAFVSPEGTSLTVVILNLARSSRTMGPDIQDFTVTDGFVIRTSATEQGEMVNESYNGQTDIEFPARSITTISFTGVTKSVIDNKPLMPDEFSLSQNYPNPFNPETTIEYSLGSESFVEVVVYDILGREIKTLVKEKMTAGKHSVRFEADDMNSGIYYYRLTAGTFTQTRKLVFMK
jgi:glucuronoarabinoxylan endo-1,4-beta-xylanase